MTLLQWQQHPQRLKIGKETMLPSRNCKPHLLSVLQLFAVPGSSVLISLHARLLLQQACRDRLFWYQYVSQIMQLYASGSTNFEQRVCNGRAYKDAGLTVPLDLVNQVFSDVVAGLHYMHSHPCAYQHLE